MTILAERLTNPLTFEGLTPATIVYQGADAEKLWKREGPSIENGSYRLLYTAFDRTRIRFTAHPGYRVLLRVVDTGQTVDVTDVGYNAPIKKERLLWFLGQVRFANKWGPK